MNAGITKAKLTATKAKNAALFQFNIFLPSSCQTGIQLNRAIKPLNCATRIKMFGLANKGGKIKTL